MDQSRHERAKRLLHEAQRQSNGIRSQWLAEHCGDDPELLQELLELSALYGKQGDILDASLPEVLGGSRLAAEPLLPGALVGNRYRIKKLLSIGGFATVYLASDERLAKRDVVVKVLDRVPGPAAADNLAREIRSLASISDPGVVGVFDTGVIGESQKPFLVTQYVEGSTLRELLRSDSLPRGAQLSIVQALAKSLSAAHVSNVLHLDLKPENIMVAFAPDGTPKVTIIDFGLASVCAEGKQNSAVIAGSGVYMAPELLSGRPTPQSDIFSLGVVACEVFSGQLTRDPEQARKALSAHGVPASAVAVLARAISAAPSARPVSVADISAALSVRQGSRLVWWVAGAAVIAVFAFALVPGWPVPRAHSLGDAFPVTTEPGFEDLPAFSPDGKRLYYSRGSDSIDRDIYYNIVGQTQSIRLTSHPADERAVACSRDGKQVAFLRTFRSADQAIVVMPSMGGPEEEVARGPGFSSVEWSGDGKSLLVSSRGTGGHRALIRVLDLASREWRVFLDPPEDSQGDIDPALSPDSKTVVFIRRSNSSSGDLYSVAVDNRLSPKSSPKRITLSQTRKQTPFWTPDGQEIVFATGPLGSMAISRVSASGGVETRVVGSPTRIGGLAVPKDAWKLAYSIDLTDSNIWRLDLASPEGPVIRKALIATSSLHDEEAKLSPDGKKIVFVSSRTGSQQLWVANSDGSSPRQLLSLEAVDSMVANWLPDSQSVVVGMDAKPEGRRSFFVNITNKKQDAFLPRVFAVGVSRDGRSVLARSAQSGRDQIWSYAIASKTGRQLTKNGGRFAEEDVDRKLVFISKQDRRDGVWTISPSGQESRITQSLGMTSSFCVRPAGLYYMKAGPPATITLRRSRDGKEVDLFTLDKRPFWGFDVSSDGKMIIFSQLDVNNQDIMVVNEFR